MRAIKISNKNKKLIHNLFRDKTRGFTKIGLDRNSHEDKGVVLLWCSVIESGFLELDYNFMFLGRCKSVCDSLLLEYDAVIAAFLKIEGMIFQDFKNG